MRLAGWLASPEKGAGQLGWLGLGRAGWAARQVFPKPSENGAGQLDWLAGSGQGWLHHWAGWLHNWAGVAA